MSYLLLFSTIVFVSLLATNVFAAVTIIQPSSEDARVEQANPDDNFGSLVDLIVRSKVPNAVEDWNIRTFIKFDLSSLPEGVTITSAKLKLFKHKSFGGSDRVYEIWRVIEDWNEGTIKWNNQPDVAETATSTAIINNTPNVWDVWDVTSDVTDFYSEAETNFGWRINDEEEDSSVGKDSEYRSNNYTADPSLRPILEVEHTTCGLSVSGFSFGSLAPEATSGDVEVAITNTGDTTTETLTVEGDDWSSDGDIMPAGQTKWSLSSGSDYDTGMTALTTSPVDIGADVSPESPLSLFFKLRILADQPTGLYSQTITFTSEC